MVVERGGTRNEAGLWIKGDGGHKHGFALLENLKKGNATTIPAILEYSANTHGDAPCMGTRQLLDRQHISENGKKFEKFQLGEYSYMSYKEVQETVVKFGKGICSIGLGKGDRIGIFAETRAEWYMAAVGCLRNNMSIVTLYTNLPDDGVIKSLNETEVSTVITSYDMLARVLQVYPKCSKISRVIILEDQLNGVGSVEDFPKDLTLTPFKEIVKMGESYEEETTSLLPTAEDLAIIMYTSGSSGHPKGVELTHENVFCAITAYAIQANLGLGDRYIAYLPLAHVMELATETALIAMNVTIAYSSPFTLTNTSTKIMKGTLGDARIAQPTSMNAVPLILDRIIKGVSKTIEKQGHLKAKIFAEALKFKQKHERPSFASKVLDTLIFQRVKAELGGQLKMLVVGGAPLSAETHSKIRAMFGCTIQVGYGATETTACTTSMESDDPRTGHCGPPNYGVKIQLKDWEEGGYFSTDEPHPRGEVVVGGPMVSRGYFNLPDQTNEVFYESDGIRWFQTGDIGEFDDTGVLHIIDRKKDLVKLSNGEYISLGNTESKLKTHNIVENICIYASPGSLNAIAILVPGIESLKKIGIALGHPEDVTVQDLCNDKKVANTILQELQAHGKNQGLGRWDLPVAVHLTPDPWTPDTGLVTAALKVKRNAIKSHFQQQIDELYDILGQQDK